MPDTQVISKLESFRVYMELCNTEKIQFSEQDFEALDAAIYAITQKTKYRKTAKRFKRKFVNILLTTKSVIRDLESCSFNVSDPAFLVVCKSINKLKAVISEDKDE